jgi:hypothetical protein
MRRFRRFTVTSQAWILALAQTLTPSLSMADSPGSKTDVIYLKNGDRVLEKQGVKAKISGGFIALAFWENSLYSSYTHARRNKICALEFGLLV